MIDPFSYWSRVLSSWQAIGETNARLARTADASRDVIASRMGKMADAVRSPMTADYAELSRMVPEKVTAFSMSGSAVVASWWKMQADWMEQAQRVGGMMMRGRLPTPGEMATMASRTSLYALHALETGSKAGHGTIAPVHKTATANARRLKGRK